MSDSPIHSPRNPVLIQNAVVNDKENGLSDEGLTANDGISEKSGKNVMTKEIGTNLINHTDKPLLEKAIPDYGEGAFFLERDVVEKLKQFKDRLKTRLRDLDEWDSVDKFMINEYKKILRDFRECFGEIK
jgi:hypothetical protein